MSQQVLKIEMFQSFFYKYKGLKLEILITARKLGNLQICQIKQHTLKQPINQRGNHKGN